MENGEWRMENGEWRMENGEWRMENGEWRISFARMLRTDVLDRCHDMRITPHRHGTGVLRRCHDGSGRQCVGHDGGRHDTAGPRRNSLQYTC
jgi:hypothetical protein